MDLYFLRHGKAEEHRADKTDRERKLVERGITDVKLVAERLRVAGVVFDAIYTSPYPRAAETARIIASSLALAHTLKECPELQSGLFGIGSLQSIASHHRSEDRLLFVGHEPDLSQTIEHLCGAVCDIKTASIACITAVRPEPNMGVLRWLLTPKLIYPISE